MDDFETELFDDVDLLEKDDLDDPEELLFELKLLWLLDV